jgi:peroxiredoxin
MHDLHIRPDDLPVPVDDGAARHLVGKQIPALALTSTTGGELDLPAVLGSLGVLYVYPRTGIPGEPLPPGWDAIPGARGCTPQSCAFRDHQRELAAHGASVAGCSTQSPAEQAEFAAREHIPYPLLSDPRLELARLLGFPTFEVDGLPASACLYKRLTLIVCAGQIEHVFYPVFPPEDNAREVLAWLAR